MGNLCSAGLRRETVQGWVSVFFTACKARMANRGRDSTLFAKKYWGLPIFLNCAKKIDCGKGAFTKHFGKNREMDDKESTHEGV